uniref:G_PROTEIN_RECEP_F1_2 domain-containing protein n=1 Tax=Rhabditophanes sp. KR3021 TaxID=114890 RepID=A0AC35U882_9BILA
MVNASVYYQIPQWSRPPRSYITNGLVNTLMTGISFMSNEMILYCACRSKFFNEEKELQGRIISVSLQYIIASVFLLGPTLWYIVVAKSYSHVHTTSCIFIKNLNIMITLSFAATTMVLAINRYCTLKFNQSPKISKMCLAFVAANLPFVGALIFMSFFVNEWVRNEVCDYISHNTYVSVGEYGLALTYIGVSILFNVLTLEQFKKKQGAGLGVAEPDTGMLERQENTKQIMARNTLIFSLYPMIFLAPTYFYNMGAYAFKGKLINYIQ